MTKNNSYGLPYSIVDFGYDDDKNNFIRKRDRGLLSSWSGAMCDPNQRSNPIL
jgi:hypothetical protein